MQLKQSACMHQSSPQVHDAISIYVCAPAAALSFIVIALMQSGTELTS